LVRDGLAHLVADQLLVQHGESVEPSYSFRHALIQEAAYGTLLKRVRKSVHAKTAQALDRVVRRGELEISESVIARHYELGECVPQAVACYREAAEESARRAGYREAAQHLTRALELLAQQPGPCELARRCGVLISLGHALWNAGEFEPAQNAFREAAEIAQRVDLPEQLARAALGYGGRTAFGTGFHDEALIALLEEALKRLADDRVALRAQVTARLRKRSPSRSRDSAAERCAPRRSAPPAPSAMREPSPRSSRTSIGRFGVPTTWSGDSPYPERS
jgi:tetratricopeptide (TPR) repeat protein